MTVKKNAKGQTAAELMTLIAEKAPALIAAGVTSLTIDGFSVTLAAATPTPASTAPLPPPDPPPEQHIDPLRDRSTYISGRVPGFDPPKDFE
jgi:hypothetical protein